MLTKSTCKDQITNNCQLMAMSTDHQFAPVENANASSYEGAGTATPSLRSRRAARARRRARNYNGGWRSGIGVL